MSIMKNKREKVKCENCGNELIFDENLVEEIDDKIYCKECANKIKEKVMKR